MLKRNILFFLGLVLSASLLWPLAKQGYFTHHDDVQVIRLYEMDKCFKDGQIPCRWVPDLGLGYGYPLFNYYAPLPYYIGEVVYLISGSFIFSAKMLFAISFIGGYFFMYLLGNFLWGKAGGVASAVLYSVAPYHAANLYVRGAMGELWGMMFAPLVLFSFFKLNKKENFKNSLSLGISIALLILSHNISVILVLPTVFLLAAILAIEKKKIILLKCLLFSIFVSVVLSSFYLLPSILEKKHVHVESMTVGYFSYTEHFKGVRKLLGNNWDWGPSIREYPGSEPDGNWFNIGWIHVGVLSASLIGYLVWLKNKTDKRKYIMIPVFGIIILAAVFLIHPRSLFVWKLFDPVIRYIQFPWRFLFLISLFTSLLGGSIFIHEIKYKNLILGLLMVISLAFNFRFFKPEKFLGLTDKDYLTGGYWDMQIRRSIFDYTPISAKLPPPGLAPDLPEILDGRVNIIKYEKGSSWQRGIIRVGEEDAVLRLPLFDFPGMEVKIDGNRVDHWNNDCRNEPYCVGLISFGAFSGEHQIEARLTNTPVRSVGNILSLVTILILTYLFFLGRNKKDKK